MRKKRTTRFLVVLSILVIFGLLIFINALDSDLVDSVLNDKKPDSSSQLSPPKQAIKLIAMPVKPAKDVISLIEPTKFKSGIYWKIDKAGYQSSYLLGTIHVDDPRVIAMTEVIKENFDKATVLCTEIKMDYIAKYKFTMEMLYKKGKTLKQVIGEPLYNRVIAALKTRDLANMNINKMKPWAAWVFLVVPIPKAEVLDDRLFRDAILQKKQRCGLENIDEHIGVFSKTPLKYQIKMLEFALDNMELIAKQSRQLIDLYVERSLEKIYQLLKQSAMVDDEELINDYYYRLVIRRNVIMVNSMLPYLQQGNAFFAVGTLHLPGKIGILQLLESRGFKVTKLY